MNEELLGKKVRVKLDDNVVQEGIFLGYSEYGEFQLADEDGTVWHGWPMLSVEEVTEEPYDPFSRDDPRTTALTPDDVQKLKEANTTKETLPEPIELGGAGFEFEPEETDAPAETVPAPANAGEGSHSGEGEAGSPQGDGSDASGGAVHLHLPGGPLSSDE